MDNKIKLSSRGEGVINFFKKYGYFFIIGIVALAIALVVILTSAKTENGDLNLEGGKTEIEDVEIPVDTKPLSFALPVNGGVILKDYVADTLVWNADLKLYETHKAMQLSSQTDLSVYSVLDGEILSVEYNYLEGGKVKIKHDNGFVSVYSSLSDGIALKTGDMIKKGDVIGTMSDSAANESLSGSHLHFELLKDDTLVNPNDYISFENK